MSNMKKIIFFVLIITFNVQIANATGINDAFKVHNGNNNDNLDAVAKTAQYNTDQTSIVPVIQIVLKVFFSVLGIIFLSFTIYGGYKYMIAGGNEENIKIALDIIRQAIIGLIIIIGAYAISEFIVETVTKNVLS